MLHTWEQTHEMDFQTTENECRPIGAVPVETSGAMDDGRFRPSPNFPAVWRQSNAATKQQTARHPGPLADGYSQFMVDGLSALILYPFNARNLSICPAHAAFMLRDLTSICPDSLISTDPLREQI